MKTISIIIMLLSFKSYACSIPLKTLTALKNNTITLGMNEVGANLILSKVELKTYNYKMEWNYGDQSIDCPDTYIVSANIKVNYPGPFFDADTGKPTQLCEASMQIAYKSVSVPGEKEKKITGKVNIESQNCDLNF